MANTAISVVELYSSLLVGSVEILQLKTLSINIYQTTMLPGQKNDNKKEKCIARYLFYRLYHRKYQTLSSIIIFQRQINTRLPINIFHLNFHLNLVNNNIFTTCVDQIRMAGKI